MRRREFLVNASMAAAGATVAAPMEAASASIVDESEFHANALAAALMKKHGTRYKVTIDCMNEFVLVHREMPPSSLPCR